MNSMETLSRQITKAITHKSKKPKPYDTKGVVQRVENGTAYVHFHGGVDETPVELTVNASVGDEVVVRVSGGRAYIVGNGTAPPTDDAVAKKARKLASEAQSDANKAQESADEAMKKANDNAEEMASIVIQFDSDIENLQEQIDGNITSWFYPVDPSMSLPPVTVDAQHPDTTGWDTDSKKDDHLGDLYYNTTTGKVWRFMHEESYAWASLDNSDIARALSIASQAQDTADSKRRVFYAQPTPPYDQGDLWVQGSGGDILRCKTAKTSSQTYEQADWILASKYTDDTLANTAKTVADRAEGKADDAQADVDDLRALTVTSVVVQYAVGTSPTSEPQTGWSTASPTWEQGKYIWQRTVTTVNGTQIVSNTACIQGAKGEQGEDGTSVTILGSYNSYAELIAAHPTGNVGDGYLVQGDLYVWTGSTWEDVGTIQGAKGDKGNKGDKGDSPTITTTKSGGTTTILSDGVSVGTVLDGTNGVSPTVSKSGDTVTITDGAGHTVTITDGADGQSIKGDDGDDAYIHVAWANSSDGTTDFSTTVATGRQYMGTYTDHTQADSTTPSSYKWVKIKGDRGYTGVGIERLVSEYNLSTSNQTADGSWVTTPPAYVSGKYYWTRTKIYYDDGNVGYAPSSAGVLNDPITTMNSNAYQALQRAGNAEDIAEAQSQYFWHDDDGVHIASEAEAPTATRNMILNSLGQLFRKGANIILGVLTGTNPSVAIYDGQGNADSNKVAQFSANGITLGKSTGASHVDIDYHSLILTDKEGVEYFHVSDLRGSDGKALITDTFNGDNDGSNVFTVDFYIESIDHVIFNGTILPSSSYSFSGYDVTITDVVFSSTSRLEIAYYTTARETKAFTIGTRNTTVTNPVIGAYSVAIGAELTASGRYSHAEGSTTEATGDYSHAEGNYTFATGKFSHSEGDATRANGDSSHAEGVRTYANGDISHAEGSFTYANGKYSHTEGNSTRAIGDASHASGTGTYADQDNQTAIGKWNTKNNANNLFAVGNGTSDTARSDAFSVYKNGTAEVKGHLLVGGSITAGSYPSGLYTEKVTIVDGLTVNHANYKTASKNIDKSGFTPIGIVGVHLENATSGGTYNTYVFTHSFYLSGNTANFTLRNVHASTDAVIKLNAVILYAKS